VLADGMGGKSGGRKAADQVLMTAKQIFERYSPSKDDAAEMLQQVVMESHLMIKLTAITAEEEPHSTIAVLIGPRDMGMPATRASTTSAAPRWCRAPSTTPTFSASWPKARSARKRRTTIRSRTC
jgi:hypothetical protein